MTPSLQKEIIVGVLSAFFTALFTGVPAVLLFWWTWQRDQERLIVQKLVWYFNKLGGGEVQARDNFGPRLDILIINRSLFPVHVSAVGFEIDGEVHQMEHPRFPAKMKRNPDQSSQYLYIADDDFDVRQIQGGDSLKVSIHHAKDRKTLGDALDTASEKYKRSTDYLVQSPKVIAMVALETGKIFTSMPFTKRIWRKALQIKKEMDGASVRSDEESEYDGEPRR